MYVSGKSQELVKFQVGEAEVDVVLQVEAVEIDAGGIENKGLGIEVEVEADVAIDIDVGIENVVGDVVFAFDDGELVVEVEGADVAYEVADVEDVEVGVEVEDQPDDPSVHGVLLAALVEDGMGHHTGQHDWARTCVLSETSRTANG